MKCNFALVVFISLSSVIGMGGCGSSSSGYLKVINSSPGSGSVDAKSGGTLIAQDLAFGAASSGYAKAGAGSNQVINFYPTGQSTVAATAKQTVVKNTYYTVLQTGISSSPRVRIVADDFDSTRHGRF